MTTVWMRSRSWLGQESLHAAVAEAAQAQPAGACDLLRLLAPEGEGLEGVGIQGDGATKAGQGGVPVAAFQSGAVDVVVGLGPGDGVLDEPGDLLEVLEAG